MPTHNATFVSNKISIVPDALCQRCAQNWQGECRAYQVAHSEEEQAQREANPKALCHKNWTPEFGRQQWQERGFEG